MASQNHIWSPYGVSINQDPFYDDGNSPEESFQNLMTQFRQHLDGKRVYILEKIGPDSFIMTLEEAAELWNKSTDSLRQACISRQGRPPRFNIGVEAVQSKRIWLVTRAGMERVFGPLDGKNTAKK